jgi:hypothetical protein
MSRFESGQRVLTNDLTWGTIVRLNSNGWHDVVLDEGGQREYDDSRMADVAQAELVWNMRDPREGSPRRVFGARTGD